jgi:hypothetical protein
MGMDRRKVRPVIVRAHLLDRRGARDLGRMTYAFLILDEDGSAILERPFGSNDLAQLCSQVRAYVRQNGLPRVKFDPPNDDDIDHGAGRRARRYEALTLQEIYFASPALGQS